MKNVYNIRLKLKHRMQSLQKLSLVNMVVHIVLGDN